MNRFGIRAHIILITAKDLGIKGSRYMVGQTRGKTVLRSSVSLACLVLYNVPVELDHALHSTGERQLILAHVMPVSLTNKCHFSFFILEYSRCMLGQTVPHDSLILSMDRSSAIFNPSYSMSP